MIIFFGPAGSGKSVQAQILAARQGWRWLSAGQLLRDSRDPQLLQQMAEGQLADNDKVNAIMADALKRADGIDRVIIDGFPRELSQAQWLVDSQPEHGRSISLVIVLEVPRDELLQRMQIRGRADDNAEAIDERLAIYEEEINPILAYLGQQNIAIAHIDGQGTVGQVHDRVMEAVTQNTPSA